MNLKHKIYLISSSTGGHAVPVLELFNGLKSIPNFLVKVVHSNSNVENSLFNKKDSIVISSGKLNRFLTFSNIKEFCKIFYAFIRSFILLIFYRPDLIFSKGGFNSVPILFWAKVLRIPFYIHESDSIMGLANRSFYLSSIKTFVSFPVSVYQLDKRKLDYSGMIVRNIEPSKDLVYEKPLILIAGGSQGSEAINKVVFKILPDLLKSYCVAHHLGAKDEKIINKVKDSLPEKLKKNYNYFTFSQDKMADALSAASLIVSRAGSTIGEIAKLKKASILIPYPYAASDHQMKNAKFLEKVGGAIIIKQDMLTADSLLDRIEFILSEKRNMEIIGNNAYSALKTDGKEYIIAEIKKLFGE